MAARSLAGRLAAQGRSAGEAVRLLIAQSDATVRTHVGLACLIVLASALLLAVGPVLLKYAVDRFGEGGAAGSLLLVGGYAAALGLAKLIDELKWAVYGRADMRLQRGLTVRLFDHLIHLPVRFHRDSRTGGVLQTVHNGVLGYRIILQHSVFTFLSVAVQIALMAAVFAHFFPPTILLILLAAFTAYAAAFVAGVARVEAPSRDASGAEVDAAAVMADHILNYDAVKSFAAERHVRDRVDRSYAGMEQAWRRFYARRSVDGVIVAAIFALSFAAVMLYSAVQVGAGRMSLGDFVLINAYLLQLAAPLETIGFAFRDIAQGAVFLEKLIALLNEDAEKGEGTALPDRADGPAELVLRDVSFGYAGGRKVLDGVSFRIAPGETAAIVGPTGAGKSTLVQLLLRFETPASGSVKLDGVPISALSAEAVREAIAVIPQHTPLFNDSVGYNIAFGRIGSGPQDVERAARTARLHDQVAAWPNGYDTIVGEYGLKLSGGERQRVAIARAALRQARLLIFDEATSSLDTAMEKQILANLIDLSQGVTTLMIAHRLSTIVHADEILVLDQGRIVERGTHAALLAAGGRYAGMWRTQQLGLGHGTAAGQDRPELTA